MIFRLRSTVTTGTRLPSSHDLCGDKSKCEYNLRNESMRQDGMEMQREGYSGDKNDPNSCGCILVVARNRVNPIRQGEIVTRCGM